MENQKTKGFPGYERYKDSGIDWIGKIPEHWRVEKGKWLFLRAERAVRPEDEIVTCFRDGEVTLRKNRRTVGFTNAALEHGYQGIRKNDLVIHAMDAFAGAIGISDSDGKSTPVYSACIPRRKNTVDVKFYAYYLRNLALSGFIQSLARGIRERSTDFRFSDFAELILSYPPLSEQTAIAKFLDNKTTQIDRTIAMKEEQIKLLNERKQIMIQEAVTKGLDPTVPMKDSGIEWIGEIPVSWEVKKLKYQVTLIPDRQIVNESELPFIGMENIESWTGKHHLTSARAEGLAGYFQKNDLLFGKLRPYLAKVFLAKEEGLCSTEFNIYRCKQDLSARYYQYLFLSYKFIDLIDSSTFGARMPRASSAYLGEQYIPNFSLNEQNAIADYLDQYCGQVYEIGEAYKKQIQALKEYKTTLINEAVTGKIKVN